MSAKQDRVLPSDKTVSDCFVASLLVPRLTGDKSLRYIDGLEKETYGNDRNVAVLGKYITTQIQSYAATRPQQSTQKEEAKVNESNQEIVGRSNDDINPFGKVIVLSQGNFKNVVEEGPVFIKFYAPW